MIQKADGLNIPDMALLWRSCGKHELSVDGDGKEAGRPRRLRVMKGDSRLFTTMNGQGDHATSFQGQCSTQLEIISGNGHGVYRRQSTRV